MRKTRVAVGGDEKRVAWRRTARTLLLVRARSSALRAEAERAAATTKARTPQVAAGERRGARACWSSKLPVQGLALGLAGAAQGKREGSATKGFSPPGNAGPHIMGPVGFGRTTCGRRRRQGRGESRSNQRTPTAGSGGREELRSHSSTAAAPARLLEEREARVEVPDHLPRRDGLHLGGRLVRVPASRGGLGRVLVKDPRAEVRDRVGEEGRELLVGVGDVVPGAVQQLLVGLREGKEAAGK